ncbi:MAG: tRNA threonylcarbamoyl adenosine modification protein, Sua5/YciO/YrdC/YwlC family [Marinobacter excellens HL-55]|uniref:Threonylcarbamoyl-AMP synthase n=1 Tax=Marinobacter excellens HL-55 TaxID=1305731 RepID=A0A0P8BG39_9GAMM|nr:MAG: tRNA threonylcarbamoyl adenosine modification protein, Sua5/YciO/YrdC/YwlC family [Marinobacter excellens HL-55]
MPDTIKLDASQPADLEHAAAILRAGNLVAMPTETVYGLAADASNIEAVRRVFEAKQRPVGHPLIVHVADPERIALWVEKVPDTARRLIEKYWPGPLTLLLPKKGDVSDFITGSHPGVAVRMPAHPATLKTMGLLGRDLVAPSANPYGRISPTSAEHVLSGLSGKIEAVLDGGDCSVGIESTILDLTGGKHVIARPGQIAGSDIEDFLGFKLSPNLTSQHAVPGSVKRHYQPVTHTVGLAAHRFSELLPRLVPDGERVGVIWWQSPPGDRASESIRLGATVDEYGRMLYTAMHSMDRANVDRIVIELPPQEPRWSAICDRLARACNEQFHGDLEGSSR